MTEIKIPLQPKQREFDEAVEKYKCVLFGGAKGGGKSHGLRSVILKRRFQYPGTVGAIFRRTYEELEANHIRPLFTAYPSLEPFYNKTRHVLNIPNGSVLEFNHCDKERDLRLYQGREIHDIGIDEVGQWIEDWFQRLRGSNRSAVPGVKARMMLTGNPGDIGHKWMKRLFITREFTEREDPNDYYFIQSKVYDNAALMDNDPEYIRNLEAEPNALRRRAYLDGDWDIWAGQFFSEFRRGIHVLPSEFIAQVQPHWTRFGIYDHGFFHPAFWVEMAVDSDGNLYVIKEWGDRGKRVDEISMAIHDVSNVDALDYCVAGTDIWAKRDGSKSIFEQFSQDLPDELKIIFQQAKTNRIQGAQQIRKHLAYQNLPEGMRGPRLFILEHCTKTIDCITRMIHDPKNPEDVLKVDATETDPWAGDDPYDCVRYGVMSRFQIPEEKLTQEEIERTFVPLTKEQRVNSWIEKRRKQADKQKKFGSRDPIYGRF
jgi:Phage terminase large subunit